MSYRLVKVASHYPAYLEDYRRRFPPEVGSSYQVEADRLHADAFGWADFYARNLRAIGVEAHEIVGNAEWLQTAWAREHGVVGGAEEVILAQVAALQPEVLFLQDTVTHGEDFVAEARRRVPSLRLVLGWCCAPYRARQEGVLRACDAVLTCTPGFLNDFRASGVSAYQLNHAFEASLSARLGEPAPETIADVMFSGSFIKGEQWHDSRGELVEQLLAGGFDLRIFGTIFEEGRGRIRLKQAAWITARMLSAAGLAGICDLVPPLAKARAGQGPPSGGRFSKALRTALRPALFGIPMYQGLRSAKVCLNVHGDVTPRYAGNMRMFEATGVGACLVTDWKENVGELFEPDTEVVTYRSIAECAEKVSWLLQNEGARAEIAARGRRRTLAVHTFAHRAAELDAIVRKLLGTSSGRSALPGLVSQGE